MPTYIQKLDKSDVSINTGNATYLMSPGTGNTGTFSFSIAPGGPNEQVYFVTQQGQINSDSWESGGSMTIEVTRTAASNMRCRVRVGRVDSNGTLIQIGTFTAFQNLTGGTTKTFTATVPTWTSAQESCGNRLILQVQVGETLSGGGATATLQVGTTNSEVVSTITENNGNCRVINIA